jgi:hypothetical protein
MSHPKTILAASKRSTPIPATSLSYRPQDYFGRHDEQFTLMTRVKGTMRREALMRALDEGQINDAPAAIKAAALSHEVRQLIGRIHPAFMGGEYLPTVTEREIEIGRISIQSTTGDVTCVYARLVGQRIAYRVVDEYGGETLSDRARRTSMKPLTMGQLIEYFLDAWDLYNCLDCNFGGDLEGMLGFFTAESEFYPCFDETVRDLVRQKFAPAPDQED